MDSLDNFNCRSSPASAAVLIPLALTVSSASSLVFESNGDPHIRTFGDVNFDCQEEGWQVLFQRGDVKIETKHERQWAPGSTAAMNAEFKISIGDVVKVSTSAGKITIGASAERDFAAATAQDLGGGNAVAKISGNQLKFTLGDITVIVNANDFGVGVPAFDFSITTADLQGVTGMCASNGACVPISGTRRKLEDLVPNGLLTDDQVKAICSSTGCKPDSFLYKGCVTDLGQIPNLDVVDNIKEAFVSQNKVVQAMETRAPECKPSETFSEDGLTCVPKPKTPAPVTSDALPIASASVAFAGVVAALLA